jgi:NAD(P)H-quinone oxidoreductase subunit 4
VFFNSNEALACDINKAALPTPHNEKAVCFGNSCVLPEEAHFSDANPREIFIAACFLLLIIGIGVYPKLATQMYDVTTVAVNAQVRDAHAQIAQSNPEIYAQSFPSPQIFEPKLATLVNNQ